MQEPEKRDESLIRKVQEAADGASVHYANNLIGQYNSVHHLAEDGWDEELLRLLERVKGDMGRFILKQRMKKHGLTS